jgi:hypothetical protein
MLTAEKFADEDAETDEYDVDSPEAAAARAEKKGCVVVFPEPNQLFIDIDDLESLQAFERVFSIVQEYLPCAYVKTPSPSGNHDRWHIVVTLERPVRDDIERIALQAILGSDRKREAHDMRRALAGHPTPTRFFELKGST